MVKVYGHLLGHPCQRMQNSWWFEEPNPGDVPGECPKCRDMNFDNSCKSRGRDGNQREWKPMCGKVLCSSLDSLPESGIRWVKKLLK